MTDDDKLVERLRGEMDNNFDGHCYTITYDTLEAVADRIEALKQHAPDALLLREAIIVARNFLAIGEPAHADRHLERALKGERP